jgi:hypothetical protein
MYIDLMIRPSLKSTGLAIIKITKATAGNFFWVPLSKINIKQSYLKTYSGLAELSSSLQTGLHLLSYFLLQSRLLRLWWPGATPVRSIFESRKSPAVCQKVSTGPWNKSGISAFQRLMDEVV